jgi:DNA-binding GntR family transcriptional regulator
MDPVRRPRTMDDDPVAQGVLKAISQKRLHPGLKLGEASLAKAFGTRRIHIRQVLAHLASRRIVTQYVNRVAFVGRPTVEEARDVFAARHVVEAATVSAAIDRLDASARDRLMHHTRRERADDRTDRWASLSLTADFHVLVAELAGNMVIMDFAKELMLRTSLAIATLEVQGSPDCSADAHPHIADLILARDRAGALEAKRRHLEEIEHRHRRGAPERDPDDITTIFQDLGIVSLGAQEACDAPYELHTACNSRRHGNGSHT